MNMDFSHNDRARKNNLKRLFKYIITKECITLYSAPKTMIDAPFDKLEKMVNNYCDGEYSTFTDKELKYLQDKWSEAEYAYSVFNVFRQKYAIIEVKLW